MIRDNYEKYIAYQVRNLLFWVNKVVQRARFPEK